jgi:hypothetical protein
VPAPMPGVAAQQPADSEVAAASGAEPLDGLRGVVTARRGEPARRRAPRADEDLPAADQYKHDPRRQAPIARHRGTCIRASADPRSAPSRSDVAPAESGSARTTSPLPDGSVGTFAANCARNRRATRCRTTLPPTERPTINPTRGGASAVKPACRCTTRQPRRLRAPSRTTEVKSPDRRIRFARGNTSPAAGEPRPTACCGPCAGERRGSRGRHACACASGSRASWRAGDCSAGRSACSRSGSIKVGLAVICRIGLRTMWPQIARVWAPGTGGAPHGVRP